MRYLDKTFTVGTYNPKMACEACVFWCGYHARWCPEPDTHLEINGLKIPVKLDPTMRKNEIIFIPLSRFPF